MYVSLQIYLYRLEGVSDGDVYMSMTEAPSYSFKKWETWFLATLGSGRYLLDFKSFALTAASSKMTSAEHM